MQVTVKSGRIEAESADAVVVNLFEGVSDPAGATGAVNSALSGAITELIAAGDFKGKLGDTALLYSRGALPAARVVVAGLGSADKFDLDAARRAAAGAVKALASTGARSVATVAHGAGIGGLDQSGAAQATVEGVLLAAYRFEGYAKPDPDAKPLEELIIVEADTGQLAAVTDGAHRGEAVAAGVELARNLGNHPANVATPAYLAEAAGALAERHGMSFEAWDRQRITAAGMGAFASVAIGAAEEPRFLVLEHAPPGTSESAPTVIVGKAVTFDTGGISLKPGADMAAMKFDMCGGAAVLGAMETVGRLALPRRIVCLVAATENMPGSRATRPGDIVRAMNGKTIEVVNTDAEGRMILADALAYAATLSPKPAAVVDLATLTGAIIVSLGHVAAGMFANDDDLAFALSGASSRTGEKLWPFPMWSEYAKAIKSDYADIKNATDKRPAGAGSIFGAKFLEEFVDYPWAHLDIAGVAWEHESIPYNGKGATGFGVRLLVDWLSAG